MSARALEAHEVVDLVEALAAAGVRAWVDRGWAVDALIGRETRAHGDLDLLLRPGDLAPALTVLVSRGCLIRSPTDARSAEATSADGARVDLHEDAAVLSPESVAEGRLAGRAVFCVSARTQLARRVRGRVRERDLAAIRLLHGELGEPLPRGVLPLPLLSAAIRLRRLGKRLLGKRRAR